MNTSRGSLSRSRGSRLRSGQRSSSRSRGSERLRASCRSSSRSRYSSILAALLPRPGDSASSSKFRSFIAVVRVCVITRIEIHDTSLPPSNRSDYRRWNAARQQTLGRRWVLLGGRRSTTRPSRVSSWRCARHRQCSSLPLRPHGGLRALTALRSARSSLRVIGCALFDAGPVARAPVCARGARRRIDGHWHSEPETRGHRQGPAMAIAFRPRPRASTISSRYGSHALALGARLDAGSRPGWWTPPPWWPDLAGRSRWTPPRKWPFLGVHRGRPFAHFPQILLARYAGLDQSEAPSP